MKLKKNKVATVHNFSEPEVGYQQSYSTKTRIHSVELWLASNTVESPILLASKEARRDPFRLDLVVEIDDNILGRVEEEEFLHVVPRAVRPTR